MPMQVLLRTVLILTSRTRQTFMFRLVDKPTQRRAVNMNQQLRWLGDNPVQDSQCHDNGPRESAMG